MNFLQFEIIDKGDELCSKPEELVLHILAHDYDRLLYSIFVLVMSHYPFGTFMVYHLNTHF